MKLCTAHVQISSTLYFLFRYGPIPAMSHILPPLPPPPYYSSVIWTKNSWYLMKTCGATGPPSFYSCQFVDNFCFAGTSNTCTSKPREVDWMTCKKKQTVGMKNDGHSLEITIKWWFGLVFSEFEGAKKGCMYWADVKLGITHFWFQ